MADLTLQEERRIVLLFAIESLGGAGTKREVLDWIQDHQLHIVGENETHIVKSREEAWRNYLAWERDALVKLGAIANVAYDDWRTTERGRTHLSELSLRLVDQRSFQYINPLAVSRILDRSLSISDEFPWAGEAEFVEGAPSLVWTVRYERSAELRTAAIKIHGRLCQGCGFDFEAKYGSLGAGFIEVHHTKPVSAMDGKTVVNAETDLAVLCSNCHRMVHRRKGNPLTICQLKAAIVEQQTAAGSTLSRR